MSEKRFNEFNTYQKIAAGMMITLVMAITLSFLIGLWWELSHAVLEFEEIQQVRIACFVGLYACVALLFSLVGENKEKEARK